jgi:starch synthase (maltosyl-transferring)
MSEYFRGNFFVNTPDILAGPLQWGPRSAFKMRATLGATLSSVWGIYNGFELCDNEKNPDKEEYADSEKYDYKVWDWERPGNIKAYISLLNRIRRENQALHEYDNLRFIPTENDTIIAYYKATKNLSNIIVTVVNLDPLNAQDTFIHLPLEEMGIDAYNPFHVQDLISGQVWRWEGSRTYVRLDPDENSAHIVKIR